MNGTFRQYAICVNTTWILLSWMNAHCSLVWGAGRVQTGIHGLHERGIRHIYTLPYQFCFYLTPVTISEIKATMTCVNIYCSVDGTQKKIAINL